MLTLLLQTIWISHPCATCSVFLCPRWAHILFMAGHNAVPCSVFHHGPSTFLSQQRALRPNTAIAPVPALPLPGLPEAISGQKLGCLLSRVMDGPRTSRRAVPRQTGCLGTVSPACCTHRLPPGKRDTVSQNTVQGQQRWEGSLRDGRQTFVAFCAVPCPAVPRKMHFKVSKLEGFQRDQQTAPCKHPLCHLFPSPPKHLLQAAVAHKPDAKGQPRYLVFIFKKVACIKPIHAPAAAVAQSAAGKKLSCCWFDPLRSQRRRGTLTDCPRPGKMIKLECNQWEKSSFCCRCKAPCAAERRVPPACFILPLERGLQAEPAFRRPPSKLPQLLERSQKRRRKEWGNKRVGKKQATWRAELPGKGGAGMQRAACHLLPGMGGSAHDRTIQPSCRGKAHGNTSQGAQPLSQWGTAVLAKPGRGLRAPTWLCMLELFPAGLPRLSLALQKGEGGWQPAEHRGRGSKAGVQEAKRSSAGW